MADMVSGNTHAKAEQWRERIAEQERSGLSVKQFCQQRGLSAWSFYDWRKRLRNVEPVRFALVDRSAEHAIPAADTADLEILFATGERLRIRSGVDTATLRVVLRALRA